MKPEEKWNNTVIEVLDREHGKKVIEWWKEQGVATNGYDGDCTKEAGNYCIYYGVIDGRFDNYIIGKVNDNNAQIITLPESKQSNKMKITSEQAQEIIDMVSPNCKWKEKLLDLWAKNIVLKQEINVDDSLYKEGYKDASEEQKKILDGIFGKSKGVQVPSVDAGGLLCDRLGGEYKGIAFCLSGYYNWEIKEDSDGVLCLIPTNK